MEGLGEWWHALVNCWCRLVDMSTCLGTKNGKRTLLATLSIQEARACSGGSVAGRTAENEQVLDFWCRFEYLLDLECF
jgi:hypothetical protein